MTLAQKIVTFRKKKGLSQEELANLAGLSLRTVQRMESNESVPRLHSLKVLAGVLDVPLAELTRPENISSQETLVHLRLLNSLSLLVVILPLVHVVVQLLVWKRNQTDEEGATLGKRIIAFQVLWTFLALLLLIITPIIFRMITGSNMIGKTSPMVVVYLVMLVVNVAFVMASAVRMQRGDTKVYSFVPSLF